MNTQKNSLTIALAAAFAVVLVVGISAVTFNNAQAAGSTAVYENYSYPSSSGSSGSSNDGGNYNTGCCTVKTTSGKGSTAVYENYTYPATTYYTPTTYTPTYGGGGGGCTSNCGGTTPKPAPTCTIVATPASITSGQAVTVTWNSSNAVQGSISNLGTNVAMSGSYTLYPTQSTTFTATFKSSDNRTVTCVTNVGVLPPPPVYCPAGYTGTYPNCVPPVQYCPAGYTGTYPNCYPPVQYNNPSCTITINNYNNNNNGYYNANQAVTLSWNSTNAQNGYINQGFGTVNLSGTRTVYPTQTTTYTGTFYGYNGQQVTCSATVYINNNTYVPPVYPNTPYVTLAAVPYTGLELGPVGTVLYWAFLAFWCALAAYLIVVKKVQNSVYNSLKTVLFGSNDTVVAAHSAHAAHVSYTTPAVHSDDVVDSFIVQQINRSRA